MAWVHLLTGIKKALKDCSLKQSVSGPGGSGDNANAITDEMMQALIMFTPLRSLMSFANGQIHYEDLTEMVDKLNKA